IVLTNRKRVTLIHLNAETRPLESSCKSGSQFSSLFSSSFFCTRGYPPVDNRLPTESRQRNPKERRPRTLVLSLVRGVTNRSTTNIRRPAWGALCHGLRLRF